MLTERPMSDIQRAIDKQAKLEAEATPGTWHQMAGSKWNVLDDKGIRLAIVGTDGNFAKDGLSDAALIAHLRNQAALALSLIHI